VPKTFVQEQLSGLNLPVVEGTDTFSNQGPEMIIGYDEAVMMKREGLFRKIGDELKNFFGLDSIKIIGILAPTKTFIDEVHIVNANGFERIQSEESLFITQDQSGQEKIFYLYDPKNIPTKL
jgi:hypothetical protein